MPGAWGEAQVIIGLKHAQSNYQSDAKVQPLLLAGLIFHPVKITRLVKLPLSLANMYIHDTTSFLTNVYKFIQLRRLVDTIVILISTLLIQRRMNVVG